jgi:hypothetical protein
MQLLFGFRLLCYTSGLLACLPKAASQRLFIASGARSKKCEASMQLCEGDKTKARQGEQKNKPKPFNKRLRVLPKQKT